MSQILDLSITFTPPPAGSDPDVLASITVRYDALGLSHSGDLLRDPLTRQEREDLQWYLEEYWQWPYEGFLSRGQQIEALLPTIGQRLYDSLFSSKKADRIVQDWLAEPESAGSFQLSLISDMPVVLSLPWELLHSEQGYLALRNRRPISIVRRLSQSQRTSNQATTFTPPLRILLVTARPEGSGFVDPRSIARELLDEVQESIDAGTIAVEFLRPPTLAALQERLRDTKRPPIHILHFDGHGVFGNGQQGQETNPHLLHGGGQGMLAFETTEGTLDLVKAEDLAQTLHDSQVQLAVLTACQSAMGSTEDVFSSVAARLIRGGIKAVSAMSASILVVSAARYTEAFYKELATGASASLAQERARQSLYTNPRRHTVSRDRSEEGEPVVLRDWWLPHFYQQVPLLLQPTGKKKRTTNKEASQEPRPPLSATMPPSPRYGFTGRSRELLQIERWLGQHKLVVIHGFGGMGKTALAREAADWLTRTGMYQRACFVTFESGQSNATSLLSQLGFFLGIYDSSYTPDNPKAALERLQTPLKQQPILIIADNLESILPGGEALSGVGILAKEADPRRDRGFPRQSEPNPDEKPLSAAANHALAGSFDTLSLRSPKYLPLKGREASLTPEERTELWNVLLNLQQLGAGVLLTTRTTAFGDGRLSEGAKVVYLPLAGLTRDDAYQLASSLLTNLRINRRRSQYQPLRDLLQQLGHHPLSIQLVLPTLRTHSLTQIQQDFAALLPQFTDDTETGRNRSLLASLEYSLRRLNEKQRELLQRLAIFEGGAIEDDLLTITEIAELDWTELRSALEQAALLTVEQIDGVNTPFLRFHPVLIPYLRGEALTQDEALKDRYAQRYYQASNYYYREDDRHPMEIRAIVQRELPNLRRAFGWLLEGGDLERAAEKANEIGRFLNFFGLHRERQQMHQRVAEALASRKQSDVLTLARTEYLHEKNLGEEEWHKGNLLVARARFQRLLARIESQPEGNPCGPGSFEHILVLERLGKCLESEGNYSEALQISRLAIALIEVRMQTDPENQYFLREQAILLADLGDILLMQGQYAGAKKAHEQSLQIKERVGDQYGQAISRVQLGTIALEQGVYHEARMLYLQTLSTFRAFGEQATEAIVWHQLGRVAQEEKNWSEAERGFRESLSLKEQLGDRVSAARTCGHLGHIALHTHRFEEAKGWYQRAVRLVQQVDPTSGDYAGHLCNLANCLVQEVKEEKVQDRSSQLEEARRYTEQALTIYQVLQSPELWKTFYVLAAIADMQGRHEAVHDYHRQEHEAFASFAGNRYQIDQQFGELFPRLVAAQDDLGVRAQMEEVLSQLEANDWHISEAIHRIWAGENDWQILVENLDNNSALFVLRVLETLAEGAETTTNAPSLEQRLSTLPPAIREALAKGDGPAFQRVFEALSAEEQRGVMEFIQALQSQQGEEKELS